MVVIVFGILDDPGVAASGAGFVFCIMRISLCSLVIWSSFDTFWTSLSWYTFRYSRLFGDISDFWRFWLLLSTWSNAECCDEVACLDTSCVVAKKLGWVGSSDDSWLPSAEFSICWSSFGYSLDLLNPGRLGSLSSLLSNRLLFLELFKCSPEESIWLRLAPKSWASLYCLFSIKCAIKWFSWS